jgi:uncharacterized membrane protein YtjA (UPF0391 family)
MMLTFGFILLAIAGILGLLGFGMITSPVLGPARVAFYFILALSLALIVYGTVQQDMHVDSRVPVQEQH